MRIRVVDVLELLASGAGHEEILEEYPYLEAADIYAAVRRAARQNSHPILLEWFSSLFPAIIHELTNGEQIVEVI